MITTSGSRGVILRRRRSKAFTDVDFDFDTNKDL
jgi:hypothetical protein